MVRCLFLLFQIFLLCFYHQASNGQANTPVSWLIKAEPGANHNAILTATANLTPGWYIYSQFLEEGGPMPTRLTFEPSTAYDLIGKAEEIGNPVTYHDAIYQMKITKYRGTASFSQKVKLNRRSTVVKGAVEYMTCNNDICIPGKQEFSITVEPLKQSP